MTTSKPSMVPSIFQSGAIAAVLLLLMTSVSAVATAADDPTPPSQPVKLIFIHHSTGGNWLGDVEAGQGFDGGLGQELMANNYYVSATNYGWTVNGDAIGDRTDIGQWWDWFRGDNRDQVMQALFNENGQNIGNFLPWSRMSTDPGGENEIIMFKSCYPNSHISGSPDDPPTTGENPIRGQSNDLGWGGSRYTVGNAKGIYNDILQYFGTRTDKLWVLITPPPIAADDMYHSDEHTAAHAANARALNEWLVNDWLDGYPHNNVAVFDFYNVLTSNGGDFWTNDIGAASGNHHRWNGSAIEHLHNHDNDFSSYGAYLDSHPTDAGGQKATAEFVPLLNIFYNRFTGGGGGPVPPTAAFSYSPTSPQPGQTVSFTDQSSGGPASWQWSFGDGATSTSRNPTHAYSSVGSYTVSLTVTNADGSDSTSKTITVAAGGGPPTAAFSFSPTTPQPGETVSFTDQSSGGPTSWQWSFGDGGSSSNRNPTHVYSSAGTYSVSLTVSSANGSDSISKSIGVGATPTFTAPDVNLPAVAKAPGRNNAYFFSRIELYNAGPVSMGVTIAYTPINDSVKATTVTQLTIPAQVQLSVFNPLNAWFGFSNDEPDLGSLMFEVQDGADPADLLVQSVVFSRNEVDGSEYGQFFPATRTHDAVQAGGTAYLSTTVDAEHFRVNLGAMAVQWGTKFTVTAIGPDGNELHTIDEVYLELGGNYQWTKTYETFDLYDGMENFLFRVDVTGGAVVPYVSVVDGTGQGSYTGTNDPTTINPLQLADEICLLQLGSIEGIADYSGSASITNFSSSATAIDATFVPRGNSGSRSTAEISIGAGATVGYEDLVGEVFGITQVVGTVILNAPAGRQIAATGREFSFIEAGGQVDGTAGQLMAGMTDGDMLAPYSTYHLLGLRRAEATDGSVERSHIAIFNPGNQAIEVTIRLYDGESGAYEGEYSTGGHALRVGAGKLIQVNSIIRSINPSFDERAKRLEVEVDGSAFVNAFRVNMSDDPITIEPLRGP